MKVVLNKDVQKVGYRGEVIVVKDGYFRNFLFPNGLATIATEKLLKVVDSRKQKIVMEKQRLLENIKDVLKKLKGLNVEIAAKVTGKSTLYAAVSAKDVVDAVFKATNVKLDADYIKFEDHIKKVGKYKVAVDFGEGSTAEIGLEVVKA